ncbi:transposase [Candidatus Enterovibrio escicola]|uniref:transposase n=1 Tax=Candidatus Enterovibrio escicola TaxID=1927127 RepID=UPI0012382896|nr:transposase [Candidatus Enterovibrio escacola]
MIDLAAINALHCLMHHGHRRCWFIFSDVVIETALMVKDIFKFLLRTLEGFLNSVSTLIHVLLQYPTYTCISKCSKNVEVKYRLLDEKLSHTSLFMPQA